MVIKSVLVTSHVVIMRFLVLLQRLPFSMCPRTYKSYQKAHWTTEKLWYKWSNIMILENTCYYNNGCNLSTHSLYITNLTCLSDDITVHGTLITLSTANSVVLNKYSRKQINKCVSRESKLSHICAISKQILKNQDATRNFHWTLCQTYANNIHEGNAESICKSLLTKGRLQSAVSQ